MPRILLIDDDVKWCDLLKDYLERLGYAVDMAHEGDTGLGRALQGGYAAILLDVMLPGKNGLEILQELRRHAQTPVLMLTAMGEESDRIVGLELGADDYIPKTFSARELLARLRAVLRRSVHTSLQRLEDAVSPFSVGELWLDPGARTASIGDKPLSLTTGEYDILLSLARAAGRVKSREQLLLEIADREFEAFDRSIDVHISSLRRKMGDDPRTPRFIHTIRGVGYLLRKPGMEVPE